MTISVIKQSISEYVIGIFFEKDIDYEHKDDGKTYTITSHI
jgi:hypothetical protein